MKISRYISLAAAAVIAAMPLASCSGKGSGGVSIKEVEETSGQPTTHPVPSETYPDFPVNYPDIEKTDIGILYEAEKADKRGPLSVEHDKMNYSGEAGSPQVQQYTAPASTTLSCELLFDNVNNMDAFMVGDNPITGMTASNIKNAAMSAFKGEYSVQRQMEGLISLLSVPSARHVIFYWGAMCFRGEVTEVTTKYTMFNKKGYPIRGTAGIQIRQGDGSPGAREPDLAYRYDDSYWDDSFKKTFTDEGKGQSAWKAATNNSLLNLKL